MSEVSAPAAVPGVPGLNPTTPQETSPPPEGAPDKAPASTLPEFLEVEGKKLSVKQLLESKKVADGAEQLRKASYEKFRESAEKEKRLQQWATSFENDPFEATIQYFESKGNPRAQAEAMARQKFEGAYKTRYIEPEMMTPEQREAAKWKAEAEKSRKEKEDWESHKKEEEESVHKQAVRQAVQQEIIDTIEKNQLPKTRFIASRINFFMQQNLKHGYEAPQEVIVQQVRDEGKGIIQAFTQGLEGDSLVDWLGPEIIKKLRQYDLGQLKGKFKTEEPQQKPPKPGDSKRKTMADVENYFNQLRRTKT